MATPNRTPAGNPPKKESNERKHQVPSGLLFQMVDALRAAARDSTHDPVLKDETRGMVADASAAWTAWQDEKMRGGGR